MSSTDNNTLSSWDERQKAIMIPFCHSKQLLKLIGGTAGDPGCGKSEVLVALQCTINSCTICLLETFHDHR